LSNLIRRYSDLRIQVFWHVMLCTGREIHDISKDCSAFKGQRVHVFGLTLEGNRVTVLQKVENHSANETALHARGPESSETPL
jgi:hypothetical protein